MIRSDIETLVGAINEAVSKGAKITPVEKRFVVQCTFLPELSKKQGDWLQAIYRRVSGGGLYERRVRV